MSHFSYLFYPLLNQSLSKTETPSRCWSRELGKSSPTPTSLAHGRRLTKVCEGTAITTRSRNCQTTPRTLIAISFSHRRLCQTMTSSPLSAFATPTSININNFKVSRDSSHWLTTDSQLIGLATRCCPTPLPPRRYALRHPERRGRTTPCPVVFAPDEIDAVEKG